MICPRIWNHNSALADAAVVFKISLHRPGSLTMFQIMKKKCHSYFCYIIISLTAHNVCRQRPHRSWKWLFKPRLKASSDSAGNRVVSQKRLIRLLVCVELMEFTLPSAKQHPSYGDCLEVKRVSELLCAGLCDTMFTVCSTLIWPVLTGPTDWICYILTLNVMHRGGCLELYYCNMVEWCSDGIQAWFRRPTGFLQCCDTVGLIIWHVQIVPEMTYNVLIEWDVKH